MDIYVDLADQFYCPQKLALLNTVPAADLRCNGQECMAWRWKWLGDPKEQKRGYCGLAGSENLHGGPRR